MKEFKFNNLNNFIAGWYINPNICKELIKFFNKNKEIHKQGISGKKYQPEIKKSTDISLNFNSSYLQDYLVELKNCLEKYKEKYSMINNISSWGILENINIQKYKKNEAYFGWHTENGSKIVSQRVLVFMTYLNNVNDNGETEWFYQKLKIKPEIGLTIFWPTDWTFHHRGCPSKKEEKYIITGWYSYL
jgi:hypothetical protein